MLGSPSPRAHPSWAARASEGCLRGPSHRQDAFPVRTVGLKQTERDSWQNFGRTQVGAAEPALWVQSHARPSPCRRCRSSPCPHGRGCGVLPRPPQLPSLIPKRGKRGYPSDVPFAALLPRLVSPGQKGTMCRMRPGTVPLSGRRGDRCKAGTHRERRLPLFGLGHFRRGGRLESHPAFGQIPDGFAHSFSFPE